MVIHIAGEVMVLAACCVDATFSLSATTAQVHRLPNVKKEEKELTEA